MNTKINVKIEDKSKSFNELSIGEFFLSERYEEYEQVISIKVSETHFFMLCFVDPPRNTIFELHTWKMDDIFIAPLQGTINIS